MAVEELINRYGRLLMGTDIKLPPKTFRPPEWLGWSLLSIGSVLVLHSWGMKKPDG